VQSLKHPFRFITIFALVLSAALLGNGGTAAAANPLLCFSGTTDGPQGGITYVIQGGSANLRKGNIRRNSAITAKGFDTDRSFTLVEIVGDQMYLETISRMGAIVDSVVRKARAISAVVSPPSSRSVSATRASRVRTG